MLATLAAALALPALAAPQDPDLTDRFRVPDGLRVTRFAESPQLYNPTAIDVDARGRVWVTEGVNYRKWNGRNPGREHPDGERVVILADTDGDGVADSSKVFVEDPELLVPLGIAVLGDRVYVSCSPKLYVYRDTDGDDVADQREVLLEGFGGRDHDHGLHSVVLGPDGRLYTALGNAGPHVVTDRDGFTLRSGSCYRSGGPESAPNEPGLRSDDGRVWTMGLVLRLDPDGGGLTPVAHNFRNPYEVALDATGAMWLSDNDDDGNQCCRTLRLLEGGNHGYGSADGSRMWRADRLPDQDVWAAHWHQDDPGVAPAGFRNGAGGPTGVAVYESGLLPESFVGTTLNCDAGRGLVWAHRAVADPQHPDAAGCAYEVETLIEPDLAADSDPHARWFRPSDVAVGPDGSVFVADWYDPGVGGHGAGDREAYGRILRLAPPGTTPSVPNGTFADPIAALRAPTPNVRYGAWEWLREAPEAAVTTRLLREWKTAKGVLRPRLVWLLAASSPTRDVVRELMADTAQPTALRVTALRALRAAGVPEVELAATVCKMESTPAALRAEAALCLRDSDWSTRGPLLITLAERHLAGDRTGLEALGLGAEGKEEELFAALILRHTDAPGAWPTWLAEVVWRLHPGGAVQALLARALDPRLDSAERIRAMTALAFVPTRAAAEAMSALAEGGPTELRGAAQHWLRRNADDAWAGFASAALAEVDPAAARELWRSDVLRVGAAAVPLEVALPGDGARTLWLVVDDAGDGYSHDWASWCDLELRGPAGTLPLHDRPLSFGETGWGELNRDRNAGGGPLAIGGQRFAHGFGVHAPARLALRIPAGYDRLVGVVGADDGGTTQNGAATSVRFVVRATEPEDRSEYQRARATLLDADAAAAARRDAALQLCADREGGLLLVQLAAQGKLPQDLRDAIAAPIFRNPDVSVRTLASEQFRRPGSGQAALPPVREILALDADPVRGRAVFHSPVAQCANCHVHRGQGRDLGPDLTGIAAKYDAPALLDAILNPNAAIAFGYEAQVIETGAGALHYGFVLADGPRIVLKDTAGQRHVIDAEDVVRREVQTISLMPDTVTLALKAQDLADLVAFLQHTPFEAERLGEPVQLFDGRSLAGWRGFFPDGTAMEEVWSVQGGILTNRGRPVGYVQTAAEYESYRLVVEWRFPTGSQPGNGGVLLRKTGPDTVWPRSIEAQLEHRNAGDFWNIGEFPMGVAADRTNGRHTRKLRPSNERPLGEWNRYEIWVDGPDVRLVVNGEIQNEAWDCEVVAGTICLQSEGAAMEFRKVELTPLRAAR